MWRVRSWWWRVPRRRRTMGALRWLLWRCGGAVKVRSARSRTEPSGPEAGKDRRSSSFLGRAYDTRRYAGHSYPRCRYRVPSGASSSDCRRCLRRTRICRAGCSRCKGRAYASFKDRQPSSCAAPKVILLGYSQGAIVARTIAKHFSGLGVLAASHLVGDPYQKPDADGVFGSGSDGQGHLPEGVG